MTFLNTVNLHKPNFLHLQQNITYTVKLVLNIGIGKIYQNQENTLKNMPLCADCHAHFHIYTILKDTDGYIYPLAGF